MRPFVTAMLLRAHANAFSAPSQASCRLHIVVTPRYVCCQPSTYLCIEESTAVLALAVFEHAVTLEQEVAVMWQRKWSAAFWLFVVNRYITLALCVIQVTPSYTFAVSSSIVCHASC